MLGRIYKLSGGGKFYIGSTTETLKGRLKHHRSRSNDSDRRQSELYIHFKNIGWEQAIIELIEEIEVETRKQLLERECIYIKESMKDPHCLNKNRPTRTTHEKKEQDKVISRKIRTENPERERSRVAEWRRNNPEKYREQIDRVLAKDRNKVVEDGVKKSWRRKNPEKYAEEKKRTAEKNKQRMLAKKNLH